MKLTQSGHNQALSTLEDRLSEERPRTGEGTPRDTAGGATMMRLSPLTRRFQRSLATKALSKTIEMEAWQNHSRHSYARRSSPIEGFALAGGLSGVMLMCLAPGILAALSSLTKSSEH